MRDQRRCRKCGRVATISYPKIHCEGCTKGLFLPLCAPSVVPLIVVCGPSGAGKSTWVQKQMLPGDIVIDLDAIKHELTGVPMYADLSFSESAFLRRNDMLAELSHSSLALKNLGRIAPKWAFFIVQAPTAAERAHWRETLQPEYVVTFEVPFATCMDRILKDERRAHQYDHWVNVVQMWWNKYEMDKRDMVLTENHTVIFPLPKPRGW